MTDKPPVVALFNSNDDTVELIRAWFEGAGIVVVSAHLDEVKRGSVDLMSFVDQHKPAAVVIDIAPPPPPGDSCDATLQWWFDQLGKPDKPSGPPAKPPALPAAC